MIKYTLKNTRIRVGLELAFPSFDKALQTACEKEFDDTSEYVRVPLDDDEDVFVEHQVGIRKSAIHAKAMYNPYEWNEYPNVTPPEKVWMQCEGHFTTGGKYKGGAVYDGEHWYVPILGTLARFNIVIERFRPWDGKGEKNADEAADH